MAKFNVVEFSIEVGLITQKGKLMLFTAISDTENRKLQLDILLHFDKFCKKHNLRYFLSDGTLIGAIRHKGFIPWDDDIDVEMPRPDWIRLRKLFVNQGYYELCYPGDPNSRFHCIKIFDNRTIKIEKGIQYHNDYLGVDIDIFAVDGSPDDPIAYRKLQTEIFNLYNKSCISKCGFSGSILHKIRAILYRIKYGNPDLLMGKALSLCQMVNYEDSNYATRYTRFGKGIGYRVPKTCYESTIDIEFEGYLFPVPVGYDVVLKAQYGDYMMLPPVEKRVTHHVNNVFWK